MLGRFEAASPLVDRMAKTMLAMGLCLIAIKLISPTTESSLGLVETAQIGSIRSGESPGQFNDEKSHIEKRFVFQGAEDLSLDDVSNSNLSFNRNDHNQFNGHNRKIRDKSDGNDSDPDNDDDEDDEDSDGDQLESGNKRAKVQGQQSSDSSGVQQVPVVAANRSEQTGVLLPAPVVIPANGKTTDEGIRPRLFKLGLLIG